MIFYHFSMTGKRLNKLLNINAKHALYRKDGKWYQLLNDFPGVLFDDNGLVIFNSKEEYDNQKELDCKKTIHIKDGISSLQKYLYYSSEQIDILSWYKFYENQNQLLFSPTDIIWFKNVTNERLGEAYMNEKNTFRLNFPTIHFNNAGSSKVNEIIILYQKIGGVPALTHLVTPIDHIVKDQIDNSKYRYTRQVKIIAKTSKNELIRISDTLLAGVNISGIAVGGNVCRLENVKGITNLSNIQFDVWNKFAPYFTSTQKKSIVQIQQIINEIENNPSYSAKEGDPQLVLHIIKERNRKIVIEKKKKALKKNKLFCEACGFSFQKEYGSDYIECHHLNPIGQNGVRETKLADLSLVCANCHRMLHKMFGDKYLSIKELNLLIKNKKTTI